MNRAHLWRRDDGNERGSAAIEFIVCIGFLWVPLFLGTTQFGMHLVQAIQVSQVCRDAGHMYAYGIDFAQTSTQYLLASFAPGLNIDPTGQGGSSVVILSTVIYVDQAACQAGGYSSTCPNYSQVVFTNQIVVGNTAIHASTYGTPSTDSTGTGNVPQGSPSASGYLNQASDVVSGFPNITLTSGSTGQQYTYIAELYSQSSSLNWLFPTGKWIDTSFFF